MKKRTFMICYCNVKFTNVGLIFELNYEKVFDALSLKFIHKYLKLILGKA